MQAHVMPILPPPTYDEVQTERLQEVENFYKQNKDRNSRNDFTIIDLGPHGQEFTAPNQTLDLELNEQRLRGKIETCVATKLTFGQLVKFLRTKAQNSFQQKNRKNLKIAKVL